MPTPFALDEVFHFTTSDGLPFSATAQCSTPTPLFLAVLVHGLNHTSEAFLPLLAHLSASALCFVRVDLRGHGLNAAALPAGQPLDLSCSRLLLDLTELLAVAQLRYLPPARQQAGPLLIGHSLGGALCAKLAQQLQAGGGGCSGLVVLDFVEGSALPCIPAALQAMQAMPRSFPDLEGAVAWLLGTGTLHSAPAARLLLPFALHSSSSCLQWRTQSSGVLSALSLELLEGWFKGASACFAACRAPRLLLLASLASLADKELTVQHMQGKFQVKVVPEASHCLHCDQPARVAAEMAAFLAGILGSAAAKAGGEQ